VYAIAKSPADRAPTTGRLRCRPPTPADGPHLWALADSVGLDLNSPYAYVMWSDYFAGSSTVAEDGDGEIVGFVTGFVAPDSPDTLFVWQVGVAEAARGQGVGGRMLDDLLTRRSVRWLEATVTPTNEASAALFQRTAHRHGADVERSTVYPADLFPGDHEAEVRFRIGPLTTGAGSTN
jgi:L-2,4-diaminobutyric acid acetyltransferase